MSKELYEAPEHIKNLLQKYSKYCFEEVQMTTEVEHLADRYIAEKVVGKQVMKIVATLHWQPLIKLMY